MLQSFSQKDDINKDIAEDVETRFDTWNFEVDMSLPEGENKKKVTGSMKDELGRAKNKVI